jgi:hypothetical protein
MERSPHVLQRIVVVAGSLCLLVASVSADTYRWKDKDGKTHYGAAVPAEYADQPYDVLNSAGMVIDHIEDTREPLEVRAERIVKERTPLISDEQRKLQSDRLLVIQYSSEEAIMEALELEIAQLGYDAKIIHQSFDSTTTAIRDQVRLAADQQRAGKQIVEDQQKQINKLYRRLDRDVYVSGPDVGVLEPLDLSFPSKPLDLEFEGGVGGDRRIRGHRLGPRRCCDSRYSRSWKIRSGG